MTDLDEGFEETDRLLWELVVLPSGRLRFRTGSGDVFDSTNQNKSQSSTRLCEDSDEESNREDLGLVSWPRSDGYGGWNHVCLTFSCRDVKDITQCNVSILMKGSLVASSLVSIIPSRMDVQKLDDTRYIDETLDTSMLSFGLDAIPGFRLTEIRSWACIRSEDDVKMMMYEYLAAAESRKKFKMKIRSKVDGKGVKSAFISPPRKVEKKTQVFDSSIKPVLNSKRDSIDGPSLQLAIDESIFEPFNSLQDNDNVLVEKKWITPINHEENDNNAHSNAKHFEETGLTDDGLKRSPATMAAGSHNVSDFFFEDIHVEESMAISNELKTSAASGLVRGPPATRHFGGNRGGLQLNSDVTSDIGAISICGSEKTIIFYHDKSPHGKTYPIGASGAITSDTFIDDGSEFLCCFLAKDKRMVVFELQSKTVVVELQMTTKLNFWRYLPPVAHGFTLTFMLITPVGGFHWMPLEHAPRPRQVWKRGPQLQGKKILSYEEGGSNGREESDHHTTVALALTSMGEQADSVEAFLLQVFGTSNILHVSSEVLGAALFCPFSIAKAHDKFEPFLVIVSKKGSDSCVSVEMLHITCDSDQSELQTDVMSSIVLDNSLFERSHNLAVPEMAMGESPEVLCLCCCDFVVLAIRTNGNFVIYKFLNGSFEHIENRNMGCFIIDAAIRKRDNDVEVVAFLCETENAKDGHIASIRLKL